LEALSQVAASPHDQHETARVDDPLGRDYIFWLTDSHLLVIISCPLAIGIAPCDG
jgi:hypothetical protein